MRLSSSSLVMARARTSCSLRSENRFKLYLAVVRGTFYGINWNHSKQRNDGFHRPAVPEILRPGQIMEQLHRLRRALEPVNRPVNHLLLPFFRPGTLGGPPLVIGRTGRILLVKHSYLDGWH